MPPAAAVGGRQRRGPAWVAVIGSGLLPGSAAAQQLTRAGHAVTVYERADRPGGLAPVRRIPEFKLEKRHLDRRLVQMLAEGTVFRCGVDVGVDVTAAQLRGDFDAVVLAGGSCVPRGLPVPGVGLHGIHQAMDYLPLANHAVADRLAGGGPAREPRISARGRNVVIIGGGDTGADCLGTVLRQQGGVRGAAGDHAPSAGAPAGQPAVAHLPDGLPGVQRSRGGWRPRLRRLHLRNSSATPAAGCGRCGWWRIGAARQAASPPGAGDRQAMRTPV